MNKLMLEVDWLSAETLTTQILQRDLQFLTNPNKAGNLFSLDPEVEKKQLKKLEKAFKKVLNYYGGEL